MIKTLRQAVLQEKERFRIPRSVQHLIPAERIWRMGSSCAAGNTL